MNIRLCFALAAALSMFLACAQSSGSGGASRANSDLITRAELVELDVGNVYEAIQRLRPLWLRVRGGGGASQMAAEVVVFQDQAFLGDVDQLRRLGTEGIYTIRHLNRSEASALPGMASRGTHIVGAIIVSMRPPRPDGT